MWGGSQTFLYQPQTATQINRAFENFAINMGQDRDAAIIMAYAYAQQIGMYVISSELQYVRPVAAPAILANFTAAATTPGNVLVADSTSLRTLTDLTAEFNSSNPRGFRQTYWTLTVRNSATLMDELIAIFQDENNKFADAPGLVSACVFQPLPTHLAQLMAKNGANPLGLIDELQGGPLNLINIAVAWSNAADDARIFGGVRAMIGRMRETAQARGLGSKYLYQNYAAKEQDVFGSYGAANKQKILTASRKYDPARVFQKLVPGYFKIGL
jgi:hypothetical protein